MAFKNKKKQKFKNLGTFEKLDKIEEANLLIEAGRWHEAFGYLHEATRKFPAEVRFWEMLAVVGNELRDIPTMQESFAKLTQFQPKSAQAFFGLAFAYALDGKLALTTRSLREFLRRFPGDEQSAEASEMLEMTEQDLRRSLADFDFPEGDEGLELACLHEEAQVLMNRSQFAGAREKAERLVSRLPDFVPVYNNLSLILFMDGEVQKASETAEQVLAKQPENFHALANLVRFSVFLGKSESAQHFADRLRSVKSDKPDVWIKKIEAFTFLADDKSVVEIFKESNKQSDLAVPENYGKHLAAFAFYKLGKEKEARKLWQQILKDDPNFELAEQNLDELNHPESERNIFVLPLNYWIPTRYINDLFAEARQIKDGRNFEKKLQNKMSQFFEKNPNILHVLSILLERGDESAKEFAVNLMIWAATPATYAVLKDFTFSQNGSDLLRYNAAMKLAEADEIPKKVRLWNDGEWREMILMTFEITGEPTDIYPMKLKAQQLLKKGLEAMSKQNFDLAEQYNKMALEANAEDHPSLLYNLLAIGQMKGNRQNWEPALREIVRRFPDYSFAAISLATQEVKKGNIEAGKKIIERFYEKKRWHVSEIKVWFYFNLELAIAEKHFKIARMSLDMLRNFDENLDYEYWDGLLSRMELLDQLAGLPGKLLGRKRKKKS